eukprot:gb/GEZN01001932.1/.p1 GENE.gb/GEZN01001932.1/~~gb/GEZN01001932.1/.p1  ORF type:complete len:809 (-),score=126.29 gb/GEZN01001932.1/:157-2583(-)
MRAQLLRAAPAVLSRDSRGGGGGSVFESLFDEVEYDDEFDFDIEPEVALPPRTGRQAQRNYAQVQDGSHGLVVPFMANGLGGVNRASYERRRLSDVPSFKGVNSLDTQLAEKAIIAAAYIKDAIYARSTDHIFQLPQLRVYRFLHSKLYQIFVFCIILLQLCLAFFEPPCSTMCWPFPATHLIEVFILLFHMANAYGHWYCMGSKQYLKDSWRVTHLCVAVVALINLSFSFIMIYAGVLSFTATPTSMFLTRLMRPFFLISSFKRLRRISHRCVVTTLAVLPIWMLNLTLISVWACLGFVFFSQIPDYRYFATVSDSWISLYVLLSAANFPDIMLPAYNLNPWNSLYFIFFLVIGYFIFSNLILGTVYNNYKKQCAKSLNRGVEKSSAALRLAFLVLDRDQDGLIRYQTDLSLFIATIQQVNAKLSNLMCRSFFFALDHDEDGNLSLEDFGYLLNYIGKTYRFQTDSPIEWEGVSAFVEASCPIRRMMLRDVFRKVLVDWRWEPGCCGGQWVSVNLRTIVEAVVLCSSIMYINEIIRGEGEAPFPFYYQMHLVALFIFWLETVGMVIAEGLLKYLSSFLNVLDVTLNIWGVVDLFLKLERVSIYLPYIRVLRILRLFALVPRFNMVMRTVGTSVFVLFAYFGVLIALFYFFAIIGIETFCYQLSAETVPSTQDYALYRYWNLNFDTFGNAWIVLFHQLAVNNFFVIMEAIAAVLGGATRLYFYAFRTLGVSLMCNITVAVLVEVVIFQQNSVLEDQQQKSSEETKLQEVAMAMCRGRRVSVRVDLDWENHMLSIFNPKSTNKGVRFGV